MLPSLIDTLCEKTCLCQQHMVKIGAWGQDTEIWGFFFIPVLLITRFLWNRRHNQDFVSPRYLCGQDLSVPINQGSKTIKVSAGSGFY